VGDELDIDKLSLSVIRSLRYVILTALMGIILLSLTGAVVRYLIITGDGDPESSAVGSADEAIGALGNIASAAVGGLVAWMTRDLLARQEEANRMAEEVLSNQKAIQQALPPAGSTGTDDGRQR
jgi:hypothetical protein